MTSICPREQERREQLLHHLRAGALEEVPSNLLLEPPPDTRPAVMLVAEYPGSWQVFQKFRSPLERFKAITKFAIGLVTLLAALFSIPEVNLVSLWATAWGLLESAPAWLKILSQRILVPAGMVLAPTAIFLLTLFLLGQLSCTRAGQPKSRVQARIGGCRSPARHP